MNKNCKMIISGFGGQGILFAGKVLAYAAMLANKHLSWLPSYGPEMRGGTANCHVIISDEPVGSPIIAEPDILVAMNAPSLDKFEGTVAENGAVFSDKTLIERKCVRDDIEAVYVEATKIAADIGAAGLANMVMLGAVIKKTGMFTADIIKKAIEHALPPSKRKLADADMRAVMAGYELMSVAV